VKQSRRNIRNAIARNEKRADGPRLSSYARKQEEWRKAAASKPQPKNEPE
jgi:hypothetical protein